MLTRYWINQPSNLQPDHKNHGRNVLGPELAEIKKIEPARNGQKYVDIYFTDGDTVSSRISTLSLSPGWKKENAISDAQILALANMTLASDLAPVVRKRLPNIARKQADAQKILREAGYEVDFTRDAFYSNVKELERV